MPQSPSYPFISETTLDEVSERGLALYETQLKAILEPAQNGQYVAIHVDTGDYAVGRWSGSAARTLRQRHPADGRMLVRKIGEEPDFSLSNRILS